MRSAQLISQCAAYALFGATIGYFSASPVYRHLEPDKALVRLSLSVPGQIVGECRALTERQRAALPPNMRLSEICPRERSPVRVRLELDGRLLHEARLEPRGLARDGAATIHEEFVVPAGAHELRALVNDSVEPGGSGYERAQRIELAPGAVLTIDFDAKKGGVLFL
jgi:hypothetical protein